ncbi:mycofactocin-coupled SDR family oxidoreductase [Antrihabitans sp. YC3-6]|uniref:Mycofactocin-coupled SDR family oxidoreductase n=1 Tax=Antrihabitans stalagmiti TaxID=2799499 RepID=A0A934U2A4_9NOCA|nr:mycofactocin-coupled SDR family oxidoreductase [Antrihabitans stalagmiti]MBJ8338776.1 mycofactocin-coupled SDR family oxidoreductase [Antrihabitans stalagmiti]
MGQLEGRVAFITGAARGQGRNHAIRLAREGADIIAVDVCAAVSSDNGYIPATAEDLAETRNLIEAEGRKALVAEADVRDSSALQAVVDRGVEQFGRLDIVIANAGICNWSRFWEMPDEQWSTLLDINLTGVWKTLKATVPAMIAAGNGGSIITVSSVAGLKALPAQAHYSAAKHGVVGLTKSAAIELGEFKIRVNSIHPYGVDTPMGNDANALAVFRNYPRYLASFGSILTDSPLAAPDDVSDAVLWLASDASRTVTGSQLALDMGATKV